MEHLTILVSPEGRWVLPGTSDFFAALDDPDPDYDAVSFAVRNLGFIKFEVIRQSIVEIELHPRSVELPALLAVQQQLLSSDLRLFRVKYFDTSWHSEIFPSVEATIARLSELCGPHFTPSSHDRFLVEPQDIGVLFADESNNLRVMAQKWRVSFGHFDPNIITLAMHNQLLQRLAIIGIKPPHQDPVWRFLGYDHRWIGGGNYLQSGLGEKVSHIPDKEYGEWASTFYRSVAESGRPRYDLITTSIQYRDEAGKPWRPIRYERLLLPWKTPSDEVFVTMCSKRVDDAAPAAVAAWDDDASDNSAARKFAMSS
ncbi:MAG: hypothetical protein AB7H90_17800 [Alphaproteobacteria bacterium]